MFMCMHVCVCACLCWCGHVCVCALSVRLCESALPVFPFYSCVTVPPAILLPLSIRLNHLLCSSALTQRHFYKYTMILRWCERDRVDCSSTWVCPQAWLPDIFSPPLPFTSQYTSISSIPLSLALSLSLISYVSCTALIGHIHLTDKWFINGVNVTI